MALVEVCDNCQKPQRSNIFPPDIQPCRWQTAVEDFPVLLCRECRETITLARVIELAEGRPGGTVGSGTVRDPEDLLRYLVGYGGEGTG